jgi:hypothetical protein
MTTFAAEERRRLRRMVAYARVVRATVRRGAAEHARWSQFVGVTVSRMRGIGDAADARDAQMAGRYAEFFAALRQHAVGLSPPPGCESVHRAVFDWLEALDLLSAAVPAAVRSRSRADMEAIAQAANEARLRLRTVQSEYAETATTVRRQFRARPRAGRRDRAGRAA